MPPGSNTSDEEPPTVQGRPLRTWGSTGRTQQRAAATVGNEDHLGETSPTGSPHANTHQQQPYSPLTAAVAGRRAAEIPGTGTHTRTVTTDQQQQQQQPASGVAIVSLAGNSGGEAGSPRSPSRLRYTYSNVYNNDSQHAPPALPKFITVEQLPDGAAMEDVQIQHVEGSEAKRQEEVQDKIISQVDHLVEYFNALYHDDQLDISALEQELAGRDLEISQKNLIIQQLLASRQRHVPAEAGQIDPFTDDGLWAAIKRSWRQNTCCWLFTFMLLIGLVLVIALPAALVKPRTAAPASPPTFVTTPELVSATNNSLNIQLAVNQAAIVYYVVIPTTTSRRLLQAAADWQQYTAADVRAAAAGLSITNVEASTAACGTFSVHSASTNTVLTVATQSSTECTQQHAAAQTGGSKASCARCPELLPDVTYNVLLVASADASSSSLLSSAVHLEASTLPQWAGVAPGLKGGTANVQAKAAAVSETSFNLTFTLDAPGSLKYLVVYANTYARFQDRYVVFDNQVADPTSLLYSARENFEDGVVASGQIDTNTPHEEHTCTIGGTSSSSCSCTPSVNCTQKLTCFGAMCDYSTLSLAPNTTYKVLLIPASMDGRELGAPTVLSPFTTGPAVTPPVPSPQMSINPLVGPDRFSIQHIQQDKPGFVHIIVTQPLIQMGSKSGQGSGATSNQLPAGTATAFQRIPTAQQPPSRSLLAANIVPMLPPDVGADSKGALFLPPCRQLLPCDSQAAASDYVNTAVEKLVYQKCVPIQKITEATEATVSSLANNTLYRVAMIASDLNSNQDVYSALVRTQDLTPPVLTVMDTPPPDFNRFTVVVQLDEPGTLYAGLMLRADLGVVTAEAGCPPSFKVPTTGEATLPVAAGSMDVNVTFDQGLAANTDYLLKLIAEDNHGNCQQQFTDLQVHTLDNVPPEILAMDVANIGGTFAELQLTLNEPGVVHFMVLQHGPDGGVCPTADELFAGAVPSGAILPDPSATGNFSVPLQNAATPHNTTGLISQTAYRACAVAEDNTRLRNRQTTVTLKDFTTQDITPPSLAVSPIAGSDGNFTCSRTSFLCSLTFSTHLNEPGEVAWVLLPNASLPGALPAPPQLLASSNVSELLPGAVSSGSISSTDANTTVPDIPSQTTYVLLLAARDTAAKPNYLLQLSQLLLVAPDVRPPVFTGVALTSTNDTSISLNITVNEASTVYYVVAAHPSSMQTPAEVAAGKAANDAAPSAAGRISTAAKTPTNIGATGLVAAQFYDVYLIAADDPAGNLQTVVTNITSIRTTDSSPPIIYSLSASFTTPMTFTVTANISKAGRLLYAPRKVGQPAPTAQEVVNAWETRDPALANFTGQVEVPVAGSAVSGTACVADGDQMVLYAVAQDQEGLWPGRMNNTSPLSSATVQMVVPNFGASCIAPVFLAPLRPSLTFAASASQASGMPGFMLGSRNSSASATGVAWQQDAAGIYAASVVQPVQLVARAGAVRLPGSIGLEMKSLPPASVSIRIRSTVLVPDANAADGSTLRVSYQLADAAGRTQVDTAGLTVRLLLSYGSGVTPPSGVAAADNALPDCDLAAFGRSSGVGLCDVQVAGRFFPVTGILAAKAVIKVFVGTAQVAVSTAADVQLQAPPATPAFTPSTPGLLVTLPYRPVQYGETIKVTVEAVNPLAQGLTSFAVPLSFDRQKLELRSAVAAGLWLPVTVSVRGVEGSYDVVDLVVAGRAGNNDNSAYRSSSSIPLLDVYFAVTTNIPGPKPGLLSINVAPGAFSLNPSWFNPPYQFNSYNGQGPTGALNVAAVTTLGMWAWSDAYDVFNTAALTGRQVSAAVRGVLVRSYGAMDVNRGDVVSGCVVNSATGAATAALVDGLCMVHVNAVNTAPAKGLAVAMSLTDETQADPTAEVKLNVWYPTNLALSAADTTLNSVLPINAAPLSPSCMDMYQSTSLTLTADWTNGGSGAGDRLLAADVTDLVAFMSSDSNVAQVSGAKVKGLRPGSVSITTPASSNLKLSLSVSSEPVCLEQLHALATTGAALTPSAASALASAPVRTGSRTAIAWEARQSLVWEDSTALVLSYARFSDGSLMDVSDRAAVSAAVPAAAAAADVQLPFRLSTDSSTQLPVVVVNATVGTPTSCQQYLSTSWSVCSLPLGTGSGMLRVQLPSPSAVANVTASPSSITSAANAASQMPVGVATSSRLSLFVSFGDGSVREFSSDARAAFTVAAGSALCDVVQAPGGGWQVVATAAGVSGSCCITASITFTNSSQLTASVTVLVISMTQLAVAALDVNTLALPQPLAAGQLLAADSMVLLKCDARNYEQRTLWVLGVLSNCTSNTSSCPMIDLNNRQYTSLVSSSTGVADVMAGFPDPLTSYPTYPLLGNRLVPFTAGDTNLTISFAANSSSSMMRSISLTVKDTYQPAWPAAAPVNDSMAEIHANMSEAGFTVTYVLIPSSQLDLLADPPSAAAIDKSGVSLVADPASGPFYLSATADNLASGTNYTLLTSVRHGSVLSPGVTALTGLLVPDTTPPSFTKSAVAAVTADAASGRFSVRLDLGLNEQGRVFFGVYGDPACITDDPTPAEIISGMNLADVRKCNCSSRYCAAAAAGELLFNGSVTTDSVTISAASPPFPFDDLPTDSLCTNYTPTSFASTQHAIYLVAEDNLPTYKGWLSSCAMPLVSQTTPPSPCAPVTVGRCNNTPPAAEVVNRQELPYAGIDINTKGVVAPQRQPLKSVITVADPVVAGFDHASMNSTGASLIFSFQTTKPGLVQWRLVEQVTIVIANGFVAVQDASLTHEVAVSRKCSGQQLMPGTAYALWYNMTDVYGSTTDISILKITM